MKIRWLSRTGAFAGLLLAIGVATGAERNDRPLILFVGDSITSGTPSGQPHYKPTESVRVAIPDVQDGDYGYFEAIVEACGTKEIPYRFRKIGLRGQALTGPIGLACRQVLERRHRTVKEMPAYLIVQDYFVIREEADDAKEKAAQLETTLRDLAQSATKAGVKLVLSTVATDPRGFSKLKAKDEDVKRTNELLIKVAADLRVPLVRLDVAWAQYELFAKGKEPAKDWILTRQGKLADGVHPGPVGALLQALVFARELGIPAASFDEANPVLGVPKEQAAEMKRFVYSWMDAPAIAPPKGEGAKKD